MSGDVTAQQCGHVDWKRMYESAIKCAEEASKTSEHLRDLLDQLAPEWRSLDAPGRRFRPTGDVPLTPAPTPRRPGHYPTCERGAGHIGPCEPNALSANRTSPGASA